MSCWTLIFFFADCVPMHFSIVSWALWSPEAMGRLNGRDDCDEGAWSNRPHEEDLHKQKHDEHDGESHQSHQQEHKCLEKERAEGEPRASRGGPWKGWWGQGRCLLGPCTPSWRVRASRPRLPWSSMTSLMGKKAGPWSCSIGKKATKTKWSFGLT